MSLSKRKVLGIDITTNSKKEILEYIQKSLLEIPNFKSQITKNAKKILTIVTPNPEQVVLAQKDVHFRKLLNQADIAIPDGVGVVAALRLLSFKFQISNFKLKIQRIPGVELMEDLVGLASRQGFPIALIGGRAGVALKALKCLSRRVSGLAGWAMEPEEKTLEEIAQKIIKTKIRLVFVGLGAPKQEDFIERLRWEIGDGRWEKRKQNGSPHHSSRITHPLLCMSVGGAFDEISGTLPRPPVFVDNLGLKWFWRLALEPWRWKRQKALVRFLYLIYKSFLKDN